MAGHEKTALIWGEGGINRFRDDRLFPQCHGFAVVSIFSAVGGVR